MASYTLNTSPEQETIMAWWLRERAKAVPGQPPYRGPTTPGQQLLEWLATNFRPITAAYGERLRSYEADELEKAAPTDTPDAIRARALARMG